MQKRYMILMGSVFAAFAAYSVWWFSAAGAVEERLRNQIAGALPANVRATFETGEVAGFPFRFVTRMDDLVVTIGPAGNTDRFAVARAEAVMQPGNADQIVIRFEAPLEYDIAGLGRGTLTSPQFLGSVYGLEDFEVYFDFDARDAAIVTESGSAYSAERVQAHTRDRGVADDEAYEFRLSGWGLRDEAMGKSEKARFFAQGTIRHHGGSATSIGTIGPADRPVAAVDIEELVFANGDTEVRESYSLDMTDITSPSLTMRAEVTPNPSILDDMRRVDVMNSAALATLLETYGRADGKSLVLEAAFEDGVFTVNGTELSDEEAERFLSLF